MRNSTALPQRVSPFHHERILFFTHFCDCSIKTEHRCTCAKNSCNRVLVGTKVDRQFSTAFAFELTSGQWTRGTEDWVSAFDECEHHQLLDFVPFSLWTVFTDRRPLFSLNQDREMNTVLLQIFLHVEQQFEHLTRILFCDLLIRDVVEHRHEDDPCGVSFNLNNN